MSFKIVLALSCLLGLGGCEPAIMYAPPVAYEQLHISGYEGAYAVPAYGPWYGAYGRGPYGRYAVSPYLHRSVYRPGVYHGRHSVGTSLRQSSPSAVRAVPSFRRR